MKFRLMEQDQFGNKVGKHVTSDGRKLQAGDIVESNEDLTKKFAGKFERILESAEFTNTGNRQPNIPDADSLAVARGGSDSSTVPTPLDYKTLIRKYGPDVTEDFPNADDAGLMVFFSKKKSAFTVSTIDGVVLKRTRKEASVLKLIAK